MTTTPSAALLGTDELAAGLGAWAGSPDRRILEVDEDTDAYARGHLPVPWPSTGGTTSRTRSAATSSAPKPSPP